MPSKNEMFRRIAQDVGVIRYRGEVDESFCRRAAYTGARYWISAFCMDDGSNGSSGLTRQVLNRRLRAWIEKLDSAQPGLSEWFDVGSGKVSSLYNRLIDIDELIPEGFTGRFKARQPSVLKVCSGQSLIVGMFDPTNEKDVVLGHRKADIVASGLASVISSNWEESVERPRWWETEWDLLAWSRESDFGAVEYANPASHAWGLRNNEVWSSEYQSAEGIALARTSSSVHGGTAYFAVRNVRGRQFLSEIGFSKASELFYYIRKVSGNPVTARFRIVDDLHVWLKMPLGLIPGEYDRILEVVSWPVESVSDRFHRLARAECTPLVRELLSKSGVVLKEV